MSKQPKEGIAARVGFQSKIYAVPLSLMRVPAVHVSQRPFRVSRGRYLRDNLDLDKLGRLVVNHRDAVYWIVDGQHRFYALKENGLAGDSGTVDCEVFDDLTDEQMAALFLGRNDYLHVHVFDKFLINCSAGDPRCNAIRRCVESQGLKVSRDKQERCVSAVSAISRVYDIAGEIVLGQTLRTILKAFDGDHEAFDGHIIQGLGLVYNRYNGKTQERALVESLGSMRSGARGLLQRAETERSRTGAQKPICVAAVIVEIYNKGRVGRDRLASWWKQDTTAAA